jgi:hypothetical protein
MIHSLDFWLPFYQEKGKSHSGGELKKRSFAALWMTNMTYIEKQKSPTITSPF